MPRVGGLPVVRDREDAGGRPLLTLTLDCSSAAPRAALVVAESRMGPPRPLLAAPFSPLNLNPLNGGIQGRRTPHTKPVSGLAARGPLHTGCSWMLSEDREVADVAVRSSDKFG